jgi:phosphate transport system substrate-binding protein
LRASRAAGPKGERRFGNSITIKGSDTMVLPAQWWAENYLALHPHLVIQVNGGGSGTGRIAALINGTTDICQSSRPIREQERAAFRARHGREVVEVKVALDAIGVYVHEDNPLRAISLEQVRDLYASRITDWREVGGAAGKIILYSRENNSGTYEFFKEHMLANADFASRTQMLSGNAAVIHALSHDRNGIGYGGIAFAKGVLHDAARHPETMKQSEYAVCRLPAEGGRFLIETSSS